MRGEKRRLDRDAIWERRWRSCRHWPARRRSVRRKQVVFVLDASGSMAEPVAGGRKFAFVAAGVGEALASLRDQDRVTAVVFGERVRRIAEGTKKEVAGKLVDGLREIAAGSTPPSGPTVPDGALAEIERSLDEQTMVVFLTDGEIPKMDVGRWAKSLGGAKARLTLVSPGSEEGMLAELARATNAVWLKTNDAGKWPTLLKDAVELPVVGKARKNRVGWKGEGISGETGRWVETWTKEGSILRASSDNANGRALSAVARRGARTGGGHILCRRGRRLSQTDGEFDPRSNAGGGRQTICYLGGTRRRNLESARSRTRRGAVHQW